MATDKDVQDARKAGEQAGFQQAVRQLRTFTGVKYQGSHRLDALEPDLDLPEHVAYQRYWSDLVRAELELEAEAFRMEQVVEDTREDVDALERKLTADLEKRRNDRTGRSGVVRAAGWVKDQAHPLRAELKNLERLLARRQDTWRAVLVDHRNVSDEVAQVSEWLSAAAEQIAASEQERVQAIADARVEAAAARRDSSPRWCTVLTREDFLSEDDRRQAHGWHPLVAAGIDFSYDWRRDSDDAGGRGIWALHWIPETHETFLEADDGGHTIWLLGTGVRSKEDAMAMFRPLERRRRERNSVGLILDAYSQRFGPDDW